MTADGRASPTAVLTRLQSWQQVVAAAEAGPAGSSRCVLLQAALQTAADSGGLACFLLDAGYLKMFLRAKAYDVKKAEQCALNYWAFRKRVGWADDTNPASRSVCARAVESELRSGFNLLLDGVDVNGYVLLTQRMALLQTASASTIESQQRAGYYLLHRALSRPAASLQGLAMVLDFRGFRWSTFARVGTSDVQRGVAMLQDCFPAKLEVIYVLHPPGWLQAVVALLRPFLRSDSLKQKFVLCANTAALHAHIPPHVLPAAGGEWGGTAHLDWDGQVNEWIGEESRAGAGRFEPATLLTSAGGGGGQVGGSLW